MTVSAIFKTQITALVLGTLMISNSYGSERNLYERIVKSAVEQIVIQKVNDGSYANGGFSIENIFSYDGNFAPSGRWIARAPGKCFANWKTGGTNCY
jgi:hypothetical protein